MKHTQTFKCLNTSLFHVQINKYMHCGQAALVSLNRKKWLCEHRQWVSQTRHVPTMHAWNTIKDWLQPNSRFIWTKMIWFSSCLHESFNKYFLWCLKIYHYNCCKWHSKQTLQEHYTISDAEYFAGTFLYALQEIINAKFMAICIVDVNALKIRHPNSRPFQTYNYAPSIINQCK